MTFMLIISLALISFGSAVQVYQASSKGAAYTKQEESYPAHPKYQFSYAVNDEHTGDVKSQVESRDGDVVQGEYSLVDADGFKRVVHYSADNEHGFNAVVQREPLHHVAKAAAPTQVVKAVPVVKSAPISYATAPAQFKSSPATYAAAPTQATYSSQANPKSAPGTYVTVPVKKTQITYAAAQTQQSYNSQSSSVKSAPISYATAPAQFKSSPATYAAAPTQVTYSNQPNPKSAPGTYATIPVKKTQITTQQSYNSQSFTKAVQANRSVKTAQASYVRQPLAKSGAYARRSSYY